MNSEDDLFDMDYSQNDNPNINSTTSVLNDIFESTQNKIKMNANIVNMTKKCAINALLNSEFNYKKFIYPPNEDIIKEMEDTKNPNLNCKSIVSGMPYEISSQLDSEILRQFDIPMTLPDKSFETRHEIPGHEIEKKLNKNLYINNDFEVDLDLTIISEENQKQIKFSNEELFSDSKTETRKRKAESFNNNFSEKSEDFNEAKNNKMTCFGFKTGTGQQVSISKLAEQRAKRLFEEIQEREIIVNQDQSGNSNKIVFNTSANTNNQIPKMKSTLIHEETTSGDQINENFSPSKVNIGFATAAGRIIPKSKTALNQAKKHFNDIEDISETVEFISDFTEPIYPSNISAPIETPSNFDQSNSSINNNQENKEFVGFKTGTGRAILISESVKLTYQRMLDDVTKEISIEESTVSKEISHLSSVENLCDSEVDRSENNKSTTRIHPDNSRTVYKLSKEQILETDLIMKEVENMDCSWDRAETSDSWDNDSTIENCLSNLVQSPIINKTGGSKTDRKAHLLSSTPIRKPKPNVPIHSTNSLSENLDIKYDSLANRANASIKLQETTASKCTTEVSVNAGQFSRLRLDIKSKLFPMSKLFKLASTSVAESGGENIDFMSCIHIRFYCDKSIVSLEVGDNGVIVPDDKGYIGLPQFIDSFMGLPNVDPKLISVEWIRNHYQMIMWKLMALDMRYRQYLADDWLSPHHVMLQLKYRYDKEIDRAKRPSLRKICEQDDTASKRLVLVVASIEKIENDSFKVLVSDGWYCVPAIFDKFLKDQIINKKIKPGTKLILCNAVWTGCDEPIVLPVDNFPPGCGLKLHGNSTRRARAFAKLGYQSNLKPFPVTLGSLNPNGGTASLINVIINRIYPLQYMETIYHPNQDIPQRVFRNERAEEFARKQFDQSKESIVNTTLEKMMSSVSRNKKRYHSDQKKDKITDLCNGEDIMNWLRNSNDQESSLSELSFNQQNMLRIYRENLVSDALQEKCPNRNVVTLLRILVGGCLAVDVDSKQVAILTLWKPNDDLMSLLVEGASIKIYSVGVTHGKLDVQFSGTNASVALNSISMTRFERNKEIHENLIAKVYQSRQLFSIAIACQFLSDASTACEIDCIGIVIAFSKVNTTSNDSWQHVVLSDPDDMDNGIIVVKLWGGLKGNFLTSVIETGNCVKFFNLQFRKSVYSKFNPNSKIPAFECHYNTHSNVVYVSRKWNFHTMKQSIGEKLEKCLPAFEIFTNDKYNSIRSLNSRTLSPLPPKNKLIKNNVNSLNISESKPNLSPKITALTPKRLGLSNKRILKTTNLEIISQNNESLKSVGIEESGIQADIVQASNTLGYNYIDNIDMDSSIAELVKLRKRTTTINASYFANKKK